MEMYRALVMIDKTPQTPFMMVIKSANRKFLQVSAAVDGTCSSLGVGLLDPAV